MGTGMKMKNLFKGLRYLSQILVPEEEEEEKEMQIGHPTDVKHVAHIGCDGQSINNSPSWMTEFRSPATSSATVAAQSDAASDPHSGDAPAQQRSPGRNGGSERRPHRPQRPVTADSQSRDATSAEGAKPGRRHRSATAAAAEGAEDASTIPRNPQRRKPKGSSSSSSSSSSSFSASQGGGSTRSKAARCAESRSDAAKPAIEKGEGERREEK